MTEAEKFRTIQDCAIALIDRHGEELSNSELASKVGEIMSSKTSPACIAWYKTKLRAGELACPPGRDGVLAPQAHPGEGNTCESEFAYEKDLQNYLARNLEKLEPGLVLYQDADNPNIVGLEFPVVGRFVDILAKDRDGNFVVVELKVSKGYDKVVGQTLRYIGWLKKNLATEGEDVRGIIVAREVTEDIILAVSCLKNVRLVEYRLNIDFRPVGNGGKGEGM
ncbi:MAG: DUF91 domain-containing protein [Phycisphaerae bacterium]|nr:DUF91 domain-containing protein [Phycisphaerae bacterium]